MILWSIIFPGMTYRISEGMFPVINMDFMRLRIDELVFYGIAGIWAVWMILSGLSRKKQGLYLSGKSILLALIIYLWIVSSVVLGFINQNPSVIGDFRFIAPTLVGLPMAVWALRRIEQRRLLWIVKWTVSLLVISNLLLLFSQFPVFQDISYFNLWPRHVPSVGFTIILFVGLFAFFVFGRPSWPILMGVIVPLILAVFFIAKWWILGIIIGVLFVWYAALFGKSRLPLFTKKIGRVVSLSLFIGLVAVVVTKIFPEKVGQSLVTFEQRIYREDAGGDMSGGRFQMWEVIIKRIAEHPIVGSGIGFRPPEMVKGKDYGYIEDHNAVLWLAVRFGIPFLLLLAGLGFRFWRMGWRTYQTEYRQFQKTLILACMGNFIVILGLSLVGQWVLLYEINVFFCWSIAGVLALRSRGQVRLPQAPAIGGSLSRDGACDA